MSAIERLKSLARYFCGSPAKRKELSDLVAEIEALEATVERLRRRVAERDKILSGENK